MKEALTASAHCFPMSLIISARHCLRKESTASVIRYSSEDLTAAGFQPTRAGLTASVHCSLTSLMASALHCSWVEPAAMIPRSMAGTAAHYSMPALVSLGPHCSLEGLELRSETVELTARFPRSRPARIATSHSFALSRMEAAVQMKVDRIVDAETGSHVRHREAYLPHRVRPALADFA